MGGDFIVRQKDRLRKSPTFVYRLFRKVWKPLKIMFQTRKASIYIVSHQKCGRSWMYGLLTKALQLDDPAYIPTSFFFTHDKYNTEKKRCYKKKKVIFIVRDIKDTLVSFYFHLAHRTKHKKSRTFTGTLSEFLRDKKYGVENIIDFYNKWEQGKDVPAGFLMIHYEDLHNKPYETVKRFLEFIGKPCSDEVIHEAIEFSKFSNMQKMEKEGKFKHLALRPIHKEDKNALKLREGKIGGYKKYLSEEDIAYIHEVVSKKGDSLAKSLDK